MKRIYTSIISLLPILLMINKSYGHDELPVLKGTYLGQKPPGLTAKPFAPGIVNTEEWGDAGGFSPDMNEFYVTRWRHSRETRIPEAVTFKKVGDQWRRIAVPAGTRRPFHSPDGKTLHYRAKYKERTADGWSEMKSLGPAFEAIEIMGLTASAKGTLVLDERGSSAGDGIIRYSKLIDGKWEDPKPLPKEINTGKWNAHPYIAPDESYIMWDGERESGFGSSDLYISFRQKDGSLGEAINLGEKVNTGAEEGGPHITPDGKFLLFNRMVPNTNGKAGSQSDLYWIDAQIIEDLRPKE
ncbi:PD40 domain-containing protein [Microbulbifer taiwanensis]|uniref:PD40 domain-containing protein n=1 Tax=Microbulbifer taiwanensis TaxID=986746 RepID=A0ABW1YLL7_9GAMM|nr:PD40 domain-containing protein [Microbulbifer taiwanensis]